MPAVLASRNCRGPFWNVDVMTALPAVLVSWNVRFALSNVALLAELVLKKLTFAPKQAFGGEGRQPKVAFPAVLPSKKRIEMLLGKKKGPVGATCALPAVLVLWNSTVPPLTVAPPAVLEFKKFSDPAVIVATPELPVKPTPVTVRTCEKLKL